MEKWLRWRGPAMIVLLISVLIVLFDQYIATMGVSWADFSIGLINVFFSMGIGLFISLLIWLTFRFLRFIRRK